MIDPLAYVKTGGGEEGVAVLKIGILFCFKPKIIRSGITFTEVNGIICALHPYNRKIRSIIFSLLFSWPL